MDLLGDRRLVARRGLPRLRQHHQFLPGVLRENGGTAVKRWRSSHLSLAVFPRAGAADVLRFRRTDQNPGSAGHSVHFIVKVMYFWQTVPPRVGISEPTPRNLR